MQVSLLGTGLPYPNPRRRGPGYAIRAGANNFAVDCGSGVVHRMIELGLMPNEIDHLFITHLHSDHYIDLGHFIVTRWIVGDDRPWHIYGPEGVRTMVGQSSRHAAPGFRTAHEDPQGSQGNAKPPGS